jgi:hypothetical protein
MGDGRKQSAATRRGEVADTQTAQAVLDDVHGWSATEQTQPLSK